VEENFVIATNNTLAENKSLKKHNYRQEFDILLAIHGEDSKHLQRYSLKVLAGSCFIGNTDENFTELNILYLLHKQRSPDFHQTTRDALAL
jgi:hypothetical protein